MQNIPFKELSQSMMVAMVRTMYAVERTLPGPDLMTDKECDDLYAAYLGMSI